MRFLRASVAAAMVVAAIAGACSSFDGSPDAAPVDAGIDAITALPDVAAPDVAVPDDAAATGGAFVSEAHGDPHFGLSLPPVPIHVTPSGGVALGFGVLAPSTVFDRLYLSTGLGLAILDPTNTATVGLTLAQTVEIANLAVDVQGDVYIAGARISPVDNAHYAVVQKVSGTTGELLWLWEARDTADAAANDGRTSYATAIATHGTDVAITIVFDGEISYPTAPNGVRAIANVETGAEPGQNDSLVMFLSGATGNVIWKKLIGGPSGTALTQYANAVDFDENGNVIAGGYANSGGLSVEGQLVAQNTGQNIIAPFFVRFDATLSHAVSQARIVPLVTGGVGVMTALRPLPGGELAMCGRIARTDTFDGHPLTTFDGNDGYLARFGKDGIAKWVRSWGGASDDECADMAVGPTGDMSIAVNYTSSNMKLEGVPLPEPVSGKQTSAIAKYRIDGSLAWVHPTGGTTSEIGHLSVAPNGDTVYSGLFLGTADLGDGPVTTPDGVGDVTLFVVRRGL